MNITLTSNQPSLILIIAGVITALSTAASAYLLVRKALKEQRRRRQKAVVMKILPRQEENDSYPKKINPEDLSNETKIELTELYSLLAELEKEGALEKDSYGRYSRSSYTPRPSEGVV